MVVVSNVNCWKFYDTDLSLFKICSSIECVTEIKYLGVIKTIELNFSVRMDYLCKRFFSRKLFSRQVFLSLNNAPSVYIFGNNFLCM